MTYISTINGKISDTETRAMRLDSSTHAMETIEYYHHEIHGGSHYYIENYIELGSAATMSMALTTPDSEKECHLLYNISSTKGVTIEFWESGSGISGGSGVTPINNNRNSINTSDCTLLMDPLITDSGSLISQASWGSNKLGGGTTRESEIILARNTTYIRRMTSLAADNFISFHASWYEHTPKG